MKTSARTYMHMCPVHLEFLPVVTNPVFAGVCVWCASRPYRQQMTALQDNAKSRKAWRSSKDSAYFSVWPSMISASSFSFFKESPRDEQWAVSVARVACKEAKNTERKVCVSLKSPLHFDKAATYTQTHQCSCRCIRQCSWLIIKTKPLNLNLTTNWQQS